MYCNKSTSLDDTWNVEFCKTLQIISFYCAKIFIKYSHELPLRRVWYSVILIHIDSLFSPDLILSLNKDCNFCGPTWWYARTVGLIVTKEARGFMSFWICASGFSGHHPVFQSICFVLSCIKNLVWFWLYLYQGILIEAEMSNISSWFYIPASRCWNFWVHFTYLRAQSFNASETKNNNNKINQVIECLVQVTCHQHCRHELIFSCLCGEEGVLPLGYP